MNDQKPSKSIRFSSPTPIYEVNSIFKTIQGEGIFTGVPAIFIRLAGCNLQCPKCDTEYTLYEPLFLRDIMQRVVDHTLPYAGSKTLVVITGGEPFRQPLGALVTQLLAGGYRVQIETNGSYYQELPWANPDLFVICSPKLPKVHKKLLPHIDAYKYVVSAHTAVFLKGRKGIPVVSLGLIHKQDLFAAPKGSLVFISPMDDKDAERNKENQDYALLLCLKYGYTLSLQMHKILDVE